MSDDRYEGMSDAARSLLRSAGAPRPRTGPERARTARQVARIAATPVVAGGLWLSWKGALLAAALVAGGLGVAVSRRAPEQAAPSRPVTTAPSRPVTTPRAVGPAATSAPPVEGAPEGVLVPGAAPAAAASRRAAQRPPEARPARAIAAPEAEVVPEAQAVGGGGGLGASVARPTESELERVERARSLLRSDPAEALRVAEAGASESLAEEREVIAVEALHRLGRGEATRARAEAFLRRWPRSLYAERVRRWVGP